MGRVLSFRSYWLGVMAVACAFAFAYMLGAYAQMGAPTVMTLTTDCYARLQERQASDLRLRGAGPSVLYISGSSGFYGVRCGLLGKAVGRPARNLGLHAGLGSRYLLDRAISLAAPGDLIVVGLEWEIYRGPRFGEFACDYLMSRRPEYVRNLTPLEYSQLILSAGPARVLTGLFRTIAPAAGTCDDSTKQLAVNDYGDRVLSEAELAQHPEQQSGHAGILPRWQLPPTDIEGDVARFARLAEQKGARIVAVFPPMCVEGRPDTAVAEAASNGLRALWGRHGIQVLGTIEEAWYRPDQAFDTAYHLREPAAIIHTQRLAEDLLASGQIR
jgi:hypothetical protein